MFNKTFRYIGILGSAALVSLLPFKSLRAQEVDLNPYNQIETSVSGDPATFDLRYELDSGEVLYGKFMDNVKADAINRWVSVFDSQGKGIGGGYVSKDGEGLFFPSRSMDDVKCVSAETGEFRVLDEAPPEIVIEVLKDNSLNPILRIRPEEGLRRFEVYVDGNPAKGVHYPISKSKRFPMFNHVKPLIETEDDPHPVVEVIAEDHAGNRAVWRHRFTRRGVVDGEIKYDGISGEEVYERFGQAIRKTVEAIEQKHRFSVESVLISDDPEGDGGGSMFYGVDIDSGCFLNSPEDAIGILLHEIGHVKHERKFNTIRAVDGDFYRLFERAIKLDVIDTFKDSNFLSDPLGGHPTSNSHELYASAFMVSELFKQEYKERNFPGFTPEQRELAEQILDFVSR